MGIIDVLKNGQLYSECDVVWEMLQKFTKQDSVHDIDTEL